MKTDESFIHESDTQQGETPAIISPKRYKCERCGHEEIHKTNHYGPTWSLGHYATCPKCPPWAKYPEFGGNTTWLCVETPPNKAIVTYRPQQYWNDLLNIWNCEPAFNKAQQGEPTSFSEYLERNNDSIEPLDRTEATAQWFDSLNDIAKDQSIPF